MKKYDKGSYVNKRTQETCNFFSFDCCDHTREIRFVAFQDSFERLFGLVEEGRVYEIVGGGNVRYRNELYNKTRHDFEVHCHDKTRLILLTDSGQSPRVPQFYAELISWSRALNLRSGSLFGD